MIVSTPVAIINTFDKSYTDAFKLGMNKIYPELIPMVYELFDGGEITADNSNINTLRETFDHFLSMYPESRLCFLTTLNDQECRMLDEYIRESNRQVFFFSCISSYMEGIENGVSLYNNEISLRYLLASYLVDFDPYLVDIVHDNSDKGIRFTELMKQLSDVRRYSETVIRSGIYRNNIRFEQLVQVEDRTRVSIVVIEDIDKIDRVVELLESDLIIVINDNLVKSYSKRVLACMGNALDNTILSQLDKNPIMNISKSIRGPLMSAYDCGLMYTKFIQVDAPITQEGIQDYWDLILYSEPWAFITGNELENNVLRFARYDLMYTKNVVDIIPEYYEYSLGDILSLPNSVSQLASMIYNSAGVHVIPGTLVKYIDRVNDKEYQKYSTSVIDLPIIQIGRDFSVTSPIVILRNGSISDVRMPIPNEMITRTIEITEDGVNRIDEDDTIDEDDIESDYTIMDLDDL